MACRSSQLPALTKAAPSRSQLQRTNACCLLMSSVWLIKFELPYRSAMLECVSHNQMRICLQYFARCILEQQIFLTAMRNIGVSKPYPVADLYIQNAFLLLLHFQSMTLWFTSQGYFYVEVQRVCTFYYQISSHFYYCSQ